MTAEVNKRRGMFWAAARVAAGLVQRDAAELAGVGAATLQRLERGGGVHNRTLEKITDAYESRGVRVNARELTITVAASVP